MITNTLYQHTFLIYFFGEFYFNIHQIYCLQFFLYFITHTFFKTQSHTRIISIHTPPPSSQHSSYITIYFTRLSTIFGTTVSWNYCYSTNCSFLISKIPQKSLWKYFPFINIIRYTCTSFFLLKKYSTFSFIL